MSHSDSVLYHGTSSVRLASIRADKRLKLPESGEPKVSLTPELSVAEYWAQLSAGCDRDEGRGNACPVVLSFSLLQLQSAGYFVSEFRDDIWGEGECDWEREIACWSDIDFGEIVAVLPIREHAA